MHIVLLDFETSGIDPKRCVPLEVAALCVDGTTMAPIGEVFSRVIHPGAPITPENSDTKALDLHRANGLLADLSAGRGRPLREVESDMWEWLLATTLDSERKPGAARDWCLGGNNISFDRGYLERYMPELSRHFSYRSLDVSSVRMLAASVLGVSVSRLKSSLGFGQHRSTDDVKACLKELTLYRAALMQGTSWLASEVNRD